jgi:hypothetical protein
MVNVAKVLACVFVSIILLIIIIVTSVVISVDSVNVNVNVKSEGTNTKLILTNKRLPDIYTNIIRTDTSAYTNETSNVTNNSSNSVYVRVFDALKMPAVIPSLPLSNEIITEIRNILENRFITHVDNSIKINGGIDKSQIQKIVDYIINVNSNFIVFIKMDNTETTIAVCEINALLNALTNTATTSSDITFMYGGITSAVDSIMV